MAFLQKKVKNGHDYWYVMEAARVNGQPRIVRQRYLGTVEAIEAAFDAAFEPESIDDVEFGATATLFPIDDETLRYLRMTGRPDEVVARVESYAKEQTLFRTDDSPEPSFSESLLLMAHPKATPCFAVHSTAPSFS